MAHNRARDSTPKRQIRKQNTGTGCPEWKL
jgi:hypothetical protein